MGKYALKLVGSFRFTTPDGRQIPLLGDKAIALLALLATEPGGERSRKFLGEILWERSDPKRRFDSLRTELKKLKALLDTFGARDLVESDHGSIRLKVELIDIDVRAIPGKPGWDLPMGSMFLEGVSLRGYGKWDEWLAEQRAALATRARDWLAPREPPALLADVFGGQVPSAIDIVRADRLPQSPKPSVTVLPFRTVQPEDRWLGFALADEVSLLLIRFPQLFVVDSASTVALAEQGLPGPEIATRLGVRYFVEGSVTSIGDRLRVSIRLLEGETRQQVWGDVLNERPDGSGALERKIADRLAPQVWSEVHAAELSVNLRLMGIGSSRYARWWKANALFRSYEPGAVREARELSEALAAEDPTCPFSNSQAAFLNGLSHLMGLSPREEAPQRKAILYCQQALRNGSDNVEALGYSAGALVLAGGDIDLADQLVARALEILPAYQGSLFWGGWVDIVAGRPERARDRLELALRLSPAIDVRGPKLCGIGISFLMLGRPVEALEVLIEAQRNHAGFPLTNPSILVAASLAGERVIVDQARARISGSASLKFIDLLRLPAHRNFFNEILSSALDSGKDASNFI
jgi:TolB-like protein